MDVNRQLVCHIRRTATTTITCMQAISSYLLSMNKRVESFARSHWTSKVSAVARKEGFSGLWSPARLMLRPWPPSGSRPRSPTSEQSPPVYKYAEQLPRTTLSVVAERMSPTSRRYSPPHAPFSPAYAACPAWSLTAQCFLPSALPHCQVCASQIPRIACVSRSQRRSSGT
ncbi:hypothetical protein L227DRAFT_240663 [Lentinus tigrinus ALCF2SS1-6]|uniref:Uncharacterized protein n=1 Tax=Lentinus tigrinus ALCF2SS1-6 TaxID=1328759 RepID=A0A5C2S0P3_9APHY|nr:hypothetical protein L227DRAFT_240663 [Lentinus tigrinus ALCF2SS1-6]